PGDRARPPQRAAAGDRRGLDRARGHRPRDPRRPPAGHDEAPRAHRGVQRRSLVRHHVVLHAQPRLLAARPPCRSRGGIVLRAQQTPALAQQFANPRRARKARSLVALERLLRTAREHATPLCFVVFPTQRTDWNQQPYAEPRRLIEASGVPYVDLRGGADVDTSIFADLVHMNLDGRTLYTGLLADALAPVLGPGSSEAGTAFAAGGAGG